MGYVTEEEMSGVPEADVVVLDTATDEETADILKRHADLFQFSDGDDDE